MTKIMGQYQAIIREVDGTEHGAIIYAKDRESACEKAKSLVKNGAIVGIRFSQLVLVKGEEK